MEYLNNKLFRVVSEEAELLGVDAYVVGGYVRDSLLGRDRQNIDIDIVVDGSGIELAQSVANRLNRKISIYQRFGTAMVNYQGVELEFVGARRESYDPNSRKPVVEDGTLQEDRERRDFTINAMSFSLQKKNFGELIDPFDGRGDLKRKLIRTPLDADITYSDDPLRMIRAVRFAAQLGFEIEKESFEAIKRNVYRLEILSMERVSDELNKILLSKKPSVGFLLMDESGILDKIMPQLVKLKGVETIEGRGHKDNFIHSLQVVDNVAQTSDSLWLRWAALLHDIGKPATKKYDKKIGWTFHNHDFIGGRIVPGIFKSLKMPLNEKMKYVQKLVELHLRPIALVEDMVTDSAVRRLLFEAGDDVEDLMLLCEADITSKNDKKVEKYKKNFKLVRQKMVEVEEKDAVRNFQNPITGELIMQMYGVPPCREIGMMKELIKNAILDGIIENNYDSALQYLREKAEEFGLVEVVSE